MSKDLNKNKKLKSERLWNIIVLIVILAIFILYCIILPIRTIKWIRTEPTTYYSESLDEESLENAKKRTELDNRFIDRHKKDKNINFEQIKTEIEELNKDDFNLYKEQENDINRIILKIEKIKKEEIKIIFTPIITMVVVKIYILYLNFKEEKNVKLV